MELFLTLTIQIRIVNVNSGLIFRVEKLSELVCIFHIDLRIEIHTHFGCLIVFVETKKACCFIVVRLNWKSMRRTPGLHEHQWEKTPFRLQYKQNINYCRVVRDKQQY